ncbi:pentapeptide repeat-containing protein [Thermodesulfobacteriota bacterium]
MPGSGTQRAMKCLSVWLVLVLLASLPAYGEIPRASLVDYVDSERKAGRVPDIKKRFGRDLYDTDFSGLDLRGVDLNNTNPGWSNFSKADLRGADLSQADLFGPNFERADLRDTNFTGARVARGSFRHADLRGAKGFGVGGEWKRTAPVNARDVNLSGVDLRGSNLELFNLDRANLSGADMRGACVTSAEFTGANLEGIRADGTLFVLAGLSQRQRAYLSSRGAIATGADLEAAVRKGLDLSGKNLARADLSGLDLKGARMDKAWMHSIKLVGTQLQGAHLNGVFIRYSWLDGTILRDAHMRKADLAMTRLAKVDLRETDLSEAELAGAELVDCDLSEAILRGADLRKAKFIRCRLKGAVFDDANITYALFQEISGLDEERLDQLRSRAKRWRHELWVGTSAFLKKTFPMFNLIFVALTVTCFFLFRPGFSGGPEGTFGSRWGRRIARCTAVSNMLCLAAFVLVAAMILLGTSPVVQLNAGSGFHMAVWRLWVSLFLVAFSGLSGAAILMSVVCPATLALIAIGRIRERRGGLALYVSASTGLAYSTLYSILEFAPTV